MKTQNLKIGLLSLLASILLAANSARADLVDVSSTDLNTDAATTAPKKPTKPAPVKPTPTKPTPTKPTPSKPTPTTGEPAGNGGGPIQGGQVLFDTCFSPNAGCDQKLIKFITNAKTSLSIAVYSITHSGISQAIIDAKNRGIAVKMVVDKSQSKGTSSQVGALQSAGIDLKIGNFSGIMHDKFTIVDGGFLETGSYNYTANATNNNGENQLYLNDADVIQRYQENFDGMYQNGLAN